MSDEWKMSRHLRPALTFLLLLTLLAGAAYPAAITAIAQGLDPAAADGSFIQGANGTFIASPYLGQNITCAYENLTNLSSCPYRGLFWTRPSMQDYEPFTEAGDESPYGPTDPLLYNQTVYFMQEYGVFNVTAPIPSDLVTFSESGMDPDLTPEAALVQVPRVAYFTNLSQGEVLHLVSEYEVNEVFPGIGPTYVNITLLDIALLHKEGLRT